MQTMDATRWTLDHLAALERSEHDFQEFKSTGFMVDPKTGDVRGDFRDHLSKQVSAFSNASGGRLLLGIDDRGEPDDGVPRRLRPKGTREWLEDLIPGLVDPPLKRFNVFEVPLTDARAVFVVEVPPSEDAPHQARDKRYYLRIAGKSRPMGHRQVLDILHRSRDPEVFVRDVAPYGEPIAVDDDPRGPGALVCLRATFENRGRNLAQHVGCELTLPRFAVNTECRRRTLQPPEAEATGGDRRRSDHRRLMQTPGAVTFFYYHPLPIFPTQVITFSEVWLAVHAGNLTHFVAGNVVLRWKTFADAAPAREGRIDVCGYFAVKRALRLVESRLKAGT